MVAEQLKCSHTAVSRLVNQTDGAHDTNRAQALGDYSFFAAKSPFHRINILDCVGFNPILNLDGSFRQANSSMRRTG